VWISFLSLGRGRGLEAETERVIFKGTCFWDGRAVVVLSKHENEGGGWLVTFSNLFFFLGRFLENRMKSAHSASLRSRETELSCNSVRVTLAMPLKLAKFPGF
jgi:hypothetical protein